MCLRGLATAPVQGTFAVWSLSPVGAPLPPCGLWYFVPTLEKPPELQAALPSPAQETLSVAREVGVSGTILHAGRFRPALTSCHLSEVLDS